MPLNLRTWGGAGLHHLGDRDRGCGESGSSGVRGDPKSTGVRGYPTTGDVGGERGTRGEGVRVGMGGGMGVGGAGLGAGTSAHHTPP